jgi:hypothetical protein
MQMMIDVIFDGRVLMPVSVDRKSWGNIYSTSGQGVLTWQLP